MGRCLFEHPPIDAKMIAREKIKESNHGDDSALTNARPGQSQHQGIELWSAQTEPISCAPDRPDKVALVQPSGGKPDTDAVMHQYLHTVGASVGKKVSGVRVGGAKDLDDSGQGGVGDGARCVRVP